MTRPCVFALLMSIVVLAGCASSPLPPRLNSAEAGRLSELPLPYTVGVVPYNKPVYSDKLTAALQAAGIFSQVSPIAEFDGTPDFIATVEESVHGTAMIPAVAIVTFGVVPSVVREDHGLIFSLAPSSRGSRKVVIDASYSGHTTLGWAAAAVNLSPDFTSSDPDQSERFHRMLSYRTLEALRPKKGGSNAEQDKSTKP